MKTNPPKSKISEKRELLREFFINAVSVALMKEMVLVPVRAEVRNFRQGDIPEFYRG